MTFDFRQQLHYSDFAGNVNHKIGKKNPETEVSGFLVDDTGLEPVTFRTSSGCSTS